MLVFIPASPVIIVSLPHSSQCRINCCIYLSNLQVLFKFKDLLSFLTWIMLFWDRTSHYSPEWPRHHHLAQAFLFTRALVLLLQLPEYWDCRWQSPQLIHTNMVRSLSSQIHHFYLWFCQCLRWRREAACFSGVSLTGDVCQPLAPHCWCSLWWQTLCYLIS